MPSPVRDNTYTVYPRWRGEHFWSDWYRDVFNGLSPLARGTRILADHRVRATRFIPAGAGNTYAACLSNEENSVYPRWRGEHALKQWFLPLNHGLSPLARGTHSRLASNPVRSRFIPAGAGNTAALTEINYALPVYPRWRGEHDNCASSDCARLGLSPLARGTRFRQFAAHWQHRFIPAGAGNTHAVPLILTAIWVYPRWRGEHI